VDADSNFVEDNWDDSPQKKMYPASNRADDKENSGGAGAIGERAGFRPEFAGGVQADDNFVDDDWDD
jgi:hypothetical protein